MVYVNIWTHPHMSRPACLYSTTSSFQSREEREARESTQPADVDKNSRFEYWQRSVLLYIPQSCKIYCLCPLPPLKGKQKKQQECKRFDSNWSGYYAAICIICSKGTERLGESWLEKMSQWIHISAATDWTWSFPNEPRGPMKKVFRWWEKKTRERGRKERRAGWTPSLHPFSFHRGIKSSMLDFQWSERIIPEYLLRIMN